MTTFEAPAEPEPTTLMDPISAGLSDWLREVIWTGWATTARSMQQTIGMSEMGAECERQLGYKLSGTAPVNLDDDPMASMTGTGLHHVLADYIQRQHGGTGRWLLEHPVHYRAGDDLLIPGTVDAYDRRRKLILDWKTTSKQKLRTVRHDGPQTRYVVQAQLYAAALRQAGELPERVGLVYLPRDGRLSELHVWTTVPDEGFLTTWLQRLRDIRSYLDHHPGAPGDITAKPTRLCSWCPWHSPTSTDTHRACPGQAP